MTDAEEAEIVLAVSEALNADSLAVPIENVPVPKIDVVEESESDAVPLIGKKLPGKSLGCKSSLVPGVATNAAPLEEERVATN